MRRRIDITLPPGLLEWVDGIVKKDYQFRNRSHFYEVLVERYREKLKEEC